MRLYPNVRKNWLENWQLWQADRDGYFGQIAEYLATARPSHFRWHVAGDIPSLRYLHGMQEMARAYPGTMFLAYTKTEYHAEEPANLTIIRSLWTGHVYKRARPTMPVADVVLKDEYRSSLDHAGKPAIVCPGSCAGCKACYGAPKNFVVYFLQH